MAKKKSHFYPIQREMVWIKSGRIEWNRIDNGLKERFLEAVERVAAIRNEIGADSPYIKIMPPVEVIPQLWLDREKGVQIDGRSWIMTRPSGGHYFGAQIPAHTALHPDSLLVRDILVHEFAHCFDKLAQCFSLLPNSEEEAPINIADEFDPHNKEHDDSRLVDPGLFFGEADVERFLRHGDLRIDELNKTFLSLCGVLRIKRPEPKYYFQGKIQVSDEVEGRIRKIFGKDPAP